MASDDFVKVPRQEFRRHFQPSRIVLGVLPIPASTRVNVITLCFDMYCSYKPPMMAFAVHHQAYSYGLMQEAQECVLAVPGESMAEQVLKCGTTSGRNCDKVSDCRLALVGSETVGVPRLRECIANIEMRIHSRVKTGDHLTVFGEVLKFGVDEANKQRCLLSVGPEHDGYDVLAQSGIHRIAVVSKSVVVFGREGMTGGA